MRDRLEGPGLLRLGERGWSPGGTHRLGNRVDTVVLLDPLLRLRVILDVLLDDVRAHVRVHFLRDIAPQLAVSRGHRRRPTLAPLPASQPPPPACAHACRRAPPRASACTPFSTHLPPALRLLALSSCLYPHCALRYSVSCPIDPPSSLPRLCRPGQQRAPEPPTFTRFAVSSDCSDGTGSFLSRISSCAAALVPQPHTSRGNTPSMATNAEWTSMTESWRVVRGGRCKVHRDKRNAKGWSETASEEGGRLPG